MMNTISNGKPLVTTIIPTYRRPALLKRAITSALKQDGVPTQVCVYDNASGDDTAEVVYSIAKNNPRLKYHCHPENIGGLANFQYGLKQVDTPFFSFLSDDDVLLPGFYAKAIADLTRQPSARVWAGVTVRMTNTGRVYDARVEKWPREGLYCGLEGLTYMGSGYAPVWTGVLVNSEVLSTVGSLDPAVGSASDLDWLLRITARYPFVISKQVVAILTQHAHSFSENAPFSSIWPGWLKMIENVTSADTLSIDDRVKLGTLLRAYGKRVTFRHALNALAKGNHAYVGEAVLVQKEFFRDWFFGTLLDGLNRLCLSSRVLQRFYAALYNSATDCVLARRRSLQERYGALAHYLTSGCD